MRLQTRKTSGLANYLKFQYLPYIEGTMKTISVLIPKHLVISKLVKNALTKHLFDFGYIQKRYNSYICVILVMLASK